MKNCLTLLFAVTFFTHRALGFEQDLPYVDFSKEERVIFEHEIPESLKRRWKFIDVVQDASTYGKDKMTIYFMMKHSPEAIEKLEKLLFEVSDPRNDKYGKHLSREELKALTPIPESNILEVEAFLKYYGVEQYSINHNNDMIEVTLLASIAERIFQTKIKLFASTGASTKPIMLYRATTAYSLPKRIANIVDFIGDLQYFPSIRHPIAMDALQFGRGRWPNDCDGLPGCSGLITPKVLMRRYSIPSSSHARDESPVVVRKLKKTMNSMAVAEFQGQFFDNKDLKKFSEGCHVNVTVDKIIGGDIQEGGLESLLDIEYIKALAPEIPLTFIYSPEYSLFNWAKQISDDDSPQLVHSVSYGNDEAQQVSIEYMRAVNVQFMKAGSRGLSLLFASGDQGVCGREGCGIFRRRFHPDFPAGSPYVTAVGGTNFVTYNIGEEEAWSCSGGGFSDTFSTPKYQEEAVNEYLNSNEAQLPNSKFWNATSRGYPDISALGGQKTPYCVVVRQLALGIAGTSASSPVAAAIFAKLNGLRLSDGKSPLGFLNPFIYENADAFNDVSEGRNGCSFITRGFKAIKGWDPATGVGTPNYAKLRRKVMAMAK